MGTLTLAIVIAGLIVLLVQAGLCFLKAQRSIAVGALDLLLAMLIACIAWAVQTGRMVPAADFGTVMVQGEAGIWLLRFALPAVALLTAGNLVKLLHFAKRPKHEDQRRRILIAIPVAGALIGVLAASRVVCINPDEPAALQVLQYDIWWPPLILWLTACLAGPILVLSGEFDWRIWVSFSVAWTTVLAACALQFGDLPDSWSRPVWTIASPLSFALSMALLFDVVLYSRERGVRTRLLTGVPLAGLLLSIMAAPAGARIVLGVIVLAVFLWAAVAATLKEPRLGDADGQDRDNEPEWKSRLAGIATGLALPVIAIAVTDLFSAGCFPAPLDVFIVLLFWLVFAERFSEHALNRLPRLFVGNQLQLKVVLAPFRAVAGAIRAAEPALKQSVTLLESQHITAKIGMAVLLPLLVLMGTAAVNEVFNYGKIVVSSFVWLGDKDAKDDTAAAIAPGVINALGRLHDDLRQDLIEARRGQFRDNPANMHLFSAGTDNSLSSSVAQSADLEIGGVKVPLSFLAGPVQLVVRKLLQIQVIDGAVRKVKNGEYAVTFNSSYGKSWARTIQIPVAPATANPIPDTEDACPSVAPVSDPLSLGIETIAFDIATGEPEFLALGLSQDAGAFGCFRAGLRSWNTYLEAENPSDLDSAIGLFRAAVRRDHGFALAYYRLGLCLQRAGQPGAAIDEFRASYQANPGFIPAASWAARTLYSFDSTYAAQPAALPPLANRPDAAADTAQRREAMEIWSRLANLPGSFDSPVELQKLYYGLCQYERDNLQARYDAAETPPNGRVYFQSYFYCRRAEAVFSHLPARFRSGESRTLQAGVLNDIGAALDLHRQREKQVPAIQSPRACNAKSYRPGDIRIKGAKAPVYVFGGRARQALRYYRHSLDLVPDDSVVECNAAMAETFLNEGDARFLRALESASGVRYTIAGDLRYRARGAADPQTASQYFAMALDEYQRSVALDPGSFEALNGYAYACWEWYLSYRLSAASSRPGWLEELRAEQHAREAARLAFERQNDLLASTAVDTLGEVLLEKGRISEAIMNLNRAIDPNASWQSLQETRWDLAAAELCAADVSAGEQRKAHFHNAYDQLQQLRRDERTGEGQLQEWRPFHPNLDLRVHDVTDAMLRTACPGGVPAESKLEFVMQAPEYYAGEGCGVSAVTAEVEPQSGLARKPFLHVWGGNANDRVPLADKPRSIQVDFHSADDYAPLEYYAALEDRQGHALSEVRSFHLYPDAKDCRKNWIRLTFRFVPSAKTHLP